MFSQERRGHYLGKTVQIVPHITNAIQVDSPHFIHDILIGLGLDYASF